jgi:hypothetical protein
MVYKIMDKPGDNLGAAESVDFEVNQLTLRFQDL